MCGGGGGGGGGQDVFAAAQADQKRRDEEDRVARAAQQTQADVDAKGVVARNAYLSNLDAAGKGAYATGESYFKRRGLTPDPGYINEIINSITRKMPDLDPNPAQYYNEDAFAGGVANYENQQRQKYNADVGTTFAPGFERTLIPDTAADPIVNSILGEQRGAATKALDFNKARGLLNDTGYGEASRALGGQASAGLSTLRNLANSVLGVDRQRLLDIRGEAGDAASNYGFGQPAPDLTGYRTRANAQAGTDLAGIEGSVRGALGSTNLFDVPTALQKGGTLQGPINLTTAGAPGVAPPVDPNKRTQTGRGLGSSGIF